MKRHAICPTCRAKVTKDPAQPSKLYPFCSERCHLVDLGRWFGEDYRIPGTPTLESVEAALAAQSPEDE